MYTSEFQIFVAKPGKVFRSNIQQDFLGDNREEGEVITMKTPRKEICSFLAGFVFI